MKLKPILETLADTVTDVYAELDNVEKPGKITNQTRSLLTTVLSSVRELASQLVDDVVDAIHEENVVALGVPESLVPLTNSGVPGDGTTEQYLALSQYAADNERRAEDAVRRGRDIDALRASDRRLGDTLNELHQRLLAVEATVDVDLQDSLTTPSQADKVSGTDGAPEPASDNPPPLDVGLRPV